MKSLAILKIFQNTAFSAAPATLFEKKFGFGGRG